jgi:hypothetical protein
MPGGNRVAVLTMIDDDAGLSIDSIELIDCG